MHLVARIGVLAQKADRYLGDRERVSGIPTQFGKCGRMGLDAFDRDVEVRGQRGRASGSAQMARGAPSSLRAAPSKAPRSSIKILPPPPSSAGVPSTFTVRPSSSASGARARPAPTAAAAMTLCPHA